MNKEIEKELDEKLNQIHSSITDIYTNEDETIEKITENQNKKIREEAERRKLYLSILEEAKEKGNNIEFSDQMTTDKLEELVRNIEV